MTTQMEGEVMVDQQGYLRGFFERAADALEFGRDWKGLEPAM